MSSYVNFFVRRRDTGAVVSIADYGRSSMMYTHFSAILPYGKARALDARDFADVKMQMENFIAHINEYIKSVHEYIDTVKPGDTAATYETYSEDIASQLKLISESKESIDELKRALIEVEFIQDMISYKEVDVLAGIEVEWDDETHDPIILPVFEAQRLQTPHAGTQFNSRTVVSKTIGESAILSVPATSTPIQFMQ